MERCLLVIVTLMKTLDGIIRAIFLVTLSSIVMMTNSLLNRVKQDYLLSKEDIEESFDDCHWLKVSEEEQSECFPIDVLEQRIGTDVSLLFSYDSIFDGTSSSFADTIWEVSSVPSPVIPSITPSTSSSIESSDVLSPVTSSDSGEDIVNDDNIPSFPLSSVAEASGRSHTTRSCDTVTNVQCDKKNQQTETHGTCKSEPIFTDESCGMKFNEMDIEESEFGSSTDIFSHTALVLGSKLVSFITRQYLREKLSARSPSFSGETSSDSIQKKPDEVDTERRDKKKKLNRNWARRDRAKRQSREKELKGVISRLGHENKKLEMELRMLREDLVIFKNMWRVHQVFYHE